MLYREWFVHFRFPGHEDVELVDSELGPIPEGWEVERSAICGEWLIRRAASAKTIIEDVLAIGDIPWITSGTDVDAR